MRGLADTVEMASLDNQRVSGVWEERGRGTSGVHSNNCRMRLAPIQSLALKTDGGSARGLHSHLKAKRRDYRKV